MCAASSKKKISLTIDDDVYEAAQEAVKEKGTSVSAIVQKFLEFYSDPHVYCISCGTKFRTSKAVLCPLCGWLKCPECSICRCDVSDEVAKAVFYMREVYEDLLTGSVKQA